MYLQYKFNPETITFAYVLIKLLLKQHNADDLTDLFLVRV